MIKVTHVHTPFREFFESNLVIPKKYGKYNFRWFNAAAMQNYQHAFTIDSSLESSLFHRETM